MFTISFKAKKSIRRILTKIGNFLFLFQNIKYKTIFHFFEKKLFSQILISHPPLNKYENETTNNLFKKHFNENNVALCKLYLIDNISFLFIFTYFYYRCGYKRRIEML